MYYPELAEDESIYRVLNYIHLASGRMSTIPYNHLDVIYSVVRLKDNALFRRGDSINVYGSVKIIKSIDVHNGECVLRFAATAQAIPTIYDRILLKNATPHLPYYLVSSNVGTIELVYTFKEGDLLLCKTNYDMGLFTGIFKATDCDVKNYSGKNKQYYRFVINK